MDHLDDLVRLGRTVHALQARAVRWSTTTTCWSCCATSCATCRRSAERLSRTYRYVMVDEYQDTNRLQAEIVRGLAVTHDNVMAVGDDARASTRSAAPTSATSWTSRTLFPGTRVITLEENYRSTPPILDLANAIIDRAPEKYTKVLRAQAAGGTAPGAGRCAEDAQPVALRLPAHPRAARGGRAARRDRRALPLELSTPSTSSSSCSGTTSRSSSAAASSSSRRRT